MGFNYYLFLGLTIAAIASQIPHAWYVFDSFSILQKGVKIAQSLIFCSILSVGIFAFVWIGKPKLALFGAGIEMVINVYYYTLKFWDSGITNRVPDRKKKAIGIFWRQNWIKIFFAVLLPVMIFVFSEQIRQFR